MRIKHFSHVDLDGVGAVVITRRVFGEVDYEFCDYEKINKRVMEMLDRVIYRKDVEPYDLVFITDISVTPEVAAMIDRAEQKMPSMKFALLDHHQDKVDWLNDHSWATVKKEKTTDTGETIRTCGASLMYDYLIDNKYIRAEETFHLGEFAETVRQWDTYTWKRFGNTTAQDLNSLLLIKGKEVFLDRFVKSLSFKWTYEEGILLQEERQRTKRYIETKRREMRIITTRSKKRVGIVYAEQHVSTVAERICHICQTVDCVIVFSPGVDRASIRSVKDNMNVGQIAQLFGGGGNHRRAGFPAQDTKFIEKRIINI